ncbi:MAG: hypothetical protein ACXW1U_21105, partial [Methylobacter sp.]
MTRNLMIRRGMVPRIEGLRLHFINNQALGLFSALAASSNRVYRPYLVGAFGNKIDVLFFGSSFTKLCKSDTPSKHTDFQTMTEIFTFESIGSYQSLS